MRPFIPLDPVRRWGPLMALLLVVLCSLGCTARPSPPPASPSATLPSPTPPATATPSSAVTPAPSVATPTPAPSVATPTPARSSATPTASPGRVGDHADKDASPDAEGADAGEGASLRWRDQSGELELRLKTKLAGRRYRLYLPKDENVVSLAFSDRSLKVRDTASGTPILSVKARKQGFVVESPSGDVMYTALETDGGRAARVTNGAGETVATSERTVRGWEWKGADGRVAVRLDTRDSRTMTLLDANGRTRGVIELSEAAQGRHAFWLAAPGVDRVAAVALMVYFQLHS